MTERDRPSRSTVDAHRAALEALFAPKPATPTPAAVAVAKRESAKLVVRREKDEGPRAAEQSKLLARLLVAQGRTAVTKAAEEFLRAGFAFPAEQEVHLQLLEHSDEERVRDALSALAKLMESEAAKRRTVLDSRLRRLEECAEERATREEATSLRRTLARSKSE